MVLITHFTSKNCGYGSVGERSACSTMDQAKQFYTDYLFTCNQRSFMDELATRNNPSTVIFKISNLKEISELTYSVFFDLPLPPGADSNKGENSFCESQTCHCSGNWWLFSKNIDESCSLSDSQAKIQHSYQNYYANFIHTGNPNSFRENLNEQLDHVPITDWLKLSSWFYIGKDGIKQVRKDVLFENRTHAALICRPTGICQIQIRN